jgi:beta-phosphoglucomutase-like phosphatase (HAD superfamily)
MGDRDQRAYADRWTAVLGIGSDVRIITRDQVARAKPDPDLFLAAAELLRVPISSSVVVGDSVWDMLAARRAGALGIGHREDMAGRSWNMRARIVSITIRPTCSAISMKSESEKRGNRALLALGRMPCG